MKKINSKIKNLINFINIGSRICRCGHLRIFHKAKKGRCTFDRDFLWCYCATYTPKNNLDYVEFLAEKRRLNKKDSDKCKRSNNTKQRG